MGSTGPRARLATLAAPIGLAAVAAVSFLGAPPRLPAATARAAGDGGRGAAGPEMPLDVYLRHIDGLGSDVEIRVGPRRPGPVPGLESVTVTLSRDGRTQALELQRSADGRYLVPGPLLDLAADPHAPLARRLDLAQRASLGRADAPITVVEYSDFQCPYCRRLSPVVHEIMRGPLGADVRWVFKHFPLTSIHPWAEPAAVAAECARRLGGDGTFWALHDRYFGRQEALTAANHRERAVAWAREAGLPAQAFQRCLDSPEPQARVREDLAEGRAIGVSSTPTLVINGRLAPGAVGAGPLAAVLEQELVYQRTRARLLGADSRRDRGSGLRGTGGQVFTLPSSWPFGG